MGELQIGRIVEYLPDLMRGAWLTLELSALSVIIGVVVGLLLALARLSHRWLLNWPAYAYIEFFRTNSASRANRLAVLWSPYHDGA